MNGGGGVGPLSKIPCIYWLDKGKFDRMGMTDFGGNFTDFVCIVKMTAFNPNQLSEISKIQVDVPW
jgi:hypothetical protein